MSWLCIILSLLLCSLIQENLASGLYGFNEGSNFTILNATTGKISYPNYISGNQFSIYDHAYNMGVIDNINHIYFQIIYYTVPYSFNFSAYLYLWDLTNTDNKGIPKYDPIPLPFIDAIQCDNEYFNFACNDQLVANPITGDIYLWAHHNTTQSLYKLSFNPNIKNQTIKLIGNYSNINNGNIVYPPSLYIFDSKRDMLWLPGYSTGNTQLQYYYINATTGDIYKSIYDTYQNNVSSYISCTYSPNLDVIVGVMQGPRGEVGYPSYTLVHADPTSFDIIKVLSLDTKHLQWCYGQKASGYALDIDNDILYTSMYTEPHEFDHVCHNGYAIDVALAGINISDGEIISHPVYGALNQGARPILTQLAFYNPPQ